MAERYVRFCKGVYDKGRLVKPELVQTLIDKQHDYYASLFYYNENHLKEFKETGSVAGMKSVTTDRLWWDFDSKNPEEAKVDSVTLVDRLLKHGFKEENIEIYFSGNKGINVLVQTDKELTPNQVKNICVKKFGDNLNTLDLTMYDEPQILRVPYTKHEISGCFKTPLTIEDLKNTTISELKVITKDFNNLPKLSKTIAAKLDDKMLENTEVKEKVEVTFDLTKKPFHWKDYKWALLHAVGLKPKERHEALMVIAATCKGLNYDESLTRAFCKTFDEHYQKQTNEPPVSDLNNVIGSVFSDHWNGGAYSIKNSIWLQKYCQRVGIKAIEDSSFVDLSHLKDVFSDYALNFDKNVVTTGINTIDKNVLFLCSTHNGILGQPGAGKTTYALQWLKHQSLKGSPAVFYSLDMGKPIVFAKLIQSHKGCSFTEALNLFKKDPKEAAKIFDKVKEEYKNVSFNFNSGVTVDQIKTDIKNLEQTTGNKVRLLVVDYLECLQGPFSDSTANTGYLSNQMKDLANELNVCSNMLLQTQKHSVSDISDPLLSLRQIKGSSLIEQASSVVLTMWREGYSPKTVNEDRFISFAAVKNRFGSLWSDDFMWNGQKGVISEISDEGREALERLKESKRAAKAEEQSGSDWKNA